MIFYIYLPLTSKANHLDTANLMADHLIAATVEQAKERGFTSNYLAMREKDKSYINRFHDNINEFRLTGDKRISSAFELANKIVESGYENVSFHVALQDAVTNWNKVKQLRQKIDKNDEMTFSYWFNQMSHLIYSLTNLRQSAFLPIKHSEKTVYNNRMFKEAIWLISEYAGRERAIIATVIAASKPMSTQDLKNLSAYRSIVDKQLEYLGQIVVNYIEQDERQHNNSVEKTHWEAIQSNFLG